MLNPATIRSTLGRDELFAQGSPGDHEGNPAALPDASLDFLAALARRLEARTAVEFGSGRSTLALLDAGLEVTSIEDSDHWMRETLGRIGGRAAHRHIVRPLRRIWERGVPFLAWEDRIVDLSAVDLILIDSPYFPPFREPVLLSCLRQIACGVVVLDDTRIPTVRRFCDRIVAANPDVLHRRSRTGHGFDVFGKVELTPIRDSRRPLIETVKAWRRFAMGTAALAKIADQK